MEYFRVRGRYTHSTDVDDLDVVHATQTVIIDRIVRAKDANTAKHAILLNLPNDADWDCDSVEHATLADIERDELKRWNAQKPLVGFQLAVVRGEMSNEVANA